MAKNFIFKNYQFDKISYKLSLFYKYDNYLFEEVISFPKKNKILSQEKLNALDKCFFLLHIAAGISYYKAFKNPQMKIETGNLTKEQARFFNDFYYYGLAQFAATNKLSLSFDFPYSDKILQNPYDFKLSEDIFVPVGGGKDSCLTMTLLKENGFVPTTFSVNSARPIEACKQILGLEDITVHRQISPVLLENNNKFLNGHVPITGIIAFILLVCGILYDKRYVVMSCESSANEGNFGDVNHQWSKSFAFESSFYELTKQIVPNFRYFSLLRPLTELHIAKLFATKCSAYFDVFTSCNHAFHIDQSKRLTHWCGMCDKCRFVFLALAPFMNKEKLVDIIGANPLNDPEQLSGYEQLLGISGNKPFECVGTVRECRVAFELLKNKKEWKNEFIINNLYDKVNLKQDDITAVMDLQPSSLIPEVFSTCLNIKES